MLLYISQFELDKFCYYCIDLLYYFCHITKLSYAEINILLFIIIQPLLILIFATTTIWGMYIKNKKIKLWIKGLTITIVSICSLFGFLCISGYWLLRDSEMIDYLEWQVEEHPLNR